jgi:MraZ protein
MALFLSTHENKIDKKGRVSVPASFRAELSEEAFQGVVLLRSNTHNCLEGFAWSYMQEIGKRLDDFDLFSAEQDDLATSIFGTAVQLSMDGDGRIVLPQDLIGFANLSEKASFVGMGAKFQIWSPEVFEGRRDVARQAVQSKGLTIPKGRKGGGDE